MENIINSNINSTEQTISSASSPLNTPVAPPVISLSPEYLSPESTSNNQNKKHLKLGLIIGICIFLSIIFTTILFAYDKLPIKNYFWQNKTANVLISLPFMPKNPRFVLESAVKAHLKITKLSFDASLAADSKSLISILNVGQFDGQISGSVDLTDPRKPLGSINTKIGGDFDTDIMAKDQIVYFRIKSLPSSILNSLGSFGFSSDTIQNKVLNKWIYFDTKPLNTDARNNNDQQNKSIIQEAIQNYLDAFNNQEVIKSLSMTKEDLNGVKTYRLHFVPNDKALNIFWNKYTQTKENTNSNAGNYEISDFIKNFNINIWISTDKYLIQKSTLSFVFKSPNSSLINSSVLTSGLLPSQNQEISTFFSVSFSHYNEAVEVNPPQDAVKFSDLTNSLSNIDPVKQTDKARDASVKNNSAELLNSYERYYANHQFYPWQENKNSNPDILTEINNAGWMKKIFSDEELPRSFNEKLSSLDQKYTIYSKDNNLLVCFNPKSEGEIEKAKTRCSTDNKIKDTILCKINLEQSCIPY